MDYKQRIIWVRSLGEILCELNEPEWQPVINKAYQENQWFTPDQTLKALNGLALMFSNDNVEQWTSKYDFDLPVQPLKIGLIMAGNIPLVGMHDLVSCLISGNKVVVKMSSDDKTLLPALLKLWMQKHPELSEYIELVEKLTDYDAVIATGSNNSSRYFEYYFKHVPLLIRKNKHSVAIIVGHETAEDFNKLGIDLFSYFGLGCRNVSKLYIPENFNLSLFYESIESFKEIKNHNKYANNHTFYKAINLMNLVKIYDNDFLILNESTQVSTPVAVCNYEYYSDEKHLGELISRDADFIQCIVSSESNNFQTPITELNQRSFNFGQAQNPLPWDYADGVDTVEWLLNLPSEILNSPSSITPHI